MNNHNKFDLDLIKHMFVTAMGVAEDLLDVHTKIERALLKKKILMFLGKHGLCWC